MVHRSATVVEGNPATRRFGHEASGEPFLSELFRDGACPCVATMGSFDGVHRGHKALVRWAAREARARQLPLVVLTFAPRPETVLRPAFALPDICSIEDRVARLVELGADRVVVVPFNLEIAAVTAEAFVERLTSDLLVECLCVGEDFRLGAGRAAGVDGLRSLGMEVMTIPLLVGADLAKVSSTSIRRSLARGVFPQHAFELP